MQQQGKLEEAKIKAESQTQDRHSDMQQFMAQMKLDWTTLVADVQAEKAKIAANTATTLLQQGAQVEQAKEAAKQITKKESKDQ